MKYLNKVLQKNTIVHLIAVLFILFISSVYVNDSTSLKIVGDEFGYWTFGAWLAGYDWTEVASYNNYYGYGYGLLLWPILKLNLSYKLTYQLALILNVLMLVIVYFIVCKLVKKINSEMNIITRTLIALCSVMYTGVIYYTQFVLSETLICLLYWVIIYNMYSLLESYSIKKMIFYVVILCYSFAIHQRLIGLVIVGILFLCYLIIKNKKVRDILIIAPIFCVLLYLVVAIKSNYQDTYLSLSSISSEGNDFGGQVGKLKMLLSVQGVKYLFENIIGKVFYACSSTFLLFAIFLIYLFKELICCVKAKKITRNLGILMFLFFVMAISMGIAAVFLLDYTTRYDGIIYGRYFEFSLSPIIVFGLLYLNDEKNKVNNIELLCLCYMLLGVSVNNLIPYEATKSHTFINIAGVADTLFNYDYNILFLIIRTMVVFFIIVAMINIRKDNRIKMSIAMTLMIVLWSNSYLDLYSERCLSWAQGSAIKEEAMASTIIDLNAQEDLHYYLAENYIKIEYLQFILKDYTIHTFLESDYVYSLDKDDYIITVGGTKLFDNLNDVNYEAVCFTDYIVLWKYVE